MQSRKEFQKRAEISKMLSSVVGLKWKDSSHITFEPVCGLFPYLHVREIYLVTLLASFFTLIHFFLIKTRIILEIWNLRKIHVQFRPFLTCLSVLSNIAAPIRKPAVAHLHQ